MVEAVAMLRSEWLGRQVCSMDSEVADIEGLGGIDEGHQQDGNEGHFSRSTAASDEAQHGEAYGDLGR